MGLAACPEHTFPRESCDGCRARRVPPPPREVPAERLLALKFRYALRSDEDRAPFRLVSWETFIGEIERSVQGEVE